MLGGEVAALKTYRIVYQPDEEGNWLVRAPDIRGCHTYGRSLSEARTHIREALQLFVDDLADAELDEVRRLPRAARSAVDACVRARRLAVDAGDDAIRVTAAAARVLSDEFGLSTRDIGILLGVSHQRVSQLLAEGAA